MRGYSKLWVSSPSYPGFIFVGRFPLKKAIYLSFPRLSEGTHPYALWISMCWLFLRKPTWNKQRPPWQAATDAMALRVNDGWGGRLFVKTCSYMSLMSGTSINTLWCYLASRFISVDTGACRWLSGTKQRTALLICKALPSGVYSFLWFGNRAIEMIFYKEDKKAYALLWNGVIKKELYSSG